jgi:hypoxanthine phosphoribosyltransferase
VIFFSDLVRTVCRPLQIDFVVAASYGASTESSGTVRLVYDPETRLEGRHIVVVEDIVDSGLTLARSLEIMRRRRPRSLSVCALLHKRLESALQEPVRFVGFNAPREFLVGYGLDHAEDFRHLPYIAAI